MQAMLIVENVESQGLAHTGGPGQPLACRVNSSIELIGALWRRGIGVDNWSRLSESRVKKKVGWRSAAYDFPRDEPGRAP
jgi:hypothetical protein